MKTTIQPPPRKRELDLEELIAEINGISALLVSLSIPFCEGESPMSATMTGDALYTLHRYIDRVLFDLEEFTI